MQAREAARYHPFKNFCLPLSYSSNPRAKWRILQGVGATMRVTHRPRPPRRPMGMIGLYL